MTNIWSISGVPRSTHTMVFDTMRKGANLLIEQNAMSKPSGSANIKVKTNSITEELNPLSKSNDTFAKTFITYPLIGIFLFESVLV